MGILEWQRPSGLKAWVKLTLGAAAGVGLLALAVRRVDWRQFSGALRGVDLGIVAGSLAISASAMAFRAFRLSIILAVPGRFGQVWRAVALGNLGTFLLPMGGGEVTKIVALRSFLRRPAPVVATAAVLDRLFDLLGLGSMVILLLVLGIGIQVRTGPLFLGAGALVALAVGILLMLRWEGRSADGTLQSGGMAGALVQMAQTAALLGNAARAMKLVALQGLVVCLDLSGIFVGFHAFPFTRGLPLVGALKLGTYLMLGAALPMLPGGIGAHQIACMLALQPLGLTASEAFAFSVVGQGFTFLMIAALGLVAGLVGRSPEAGVG